MVAARNRPRLARPSQSCYLPVRQRLVNRKRFESALELAAANSIECHSGVGRVATDQHVPLAAATRSATTGVSLGVGVEDLFGGRAQCLGVFGVQILSEVVLDAALVVGPDFSNFLQAGFGYRQVDASTILG